MMAKTNNADDGKHVARSSDAAEEGSESGDTQRSFMDTMYNAAYYAVLFFVVQNLMTSTIAWVGQNKHDRAARDGGEAPASPMSPRSQASPQRSALQPGSLLNTFLPGDTYSVLVYLSDIDEGEFDPVRHGDKALVWSASDLSYGDWDSGIRHTLVNVSVEDHPQLRRNGSLFIHAYAVKRGGTLLKSHPDYNDRDVAELHANIVRFKQRNAIGVAPEPHRSICRRPLVWSHSRQPMKQPWESGHVQVDPARVGVGVGAKGGEGE